MMFHDERLEELTRMFMGALRCVEESVWQENVPIQPSSAHFERIEKLVLDRLTDQRERYIIGLLDELKELRELLEKTREQHHDELNKLKQLYQEQLDQSYSRSKKRNVEVEIKKHIEVRMKEIESNYILKVVHEQELVKVRSQPCSHCESGRSELKRLEQQNLCLRKELLRTQQDCNDELTRETEGRSRNFNDSKGNAMNEDQADIIYENDEAYEETSRKGSHYYSRKPNLKDSVDGFSPSASFNRGFTRGRINGTSEVAPPEETDLQTELQSIRKNLRDRHNKLMTSSKASWRPQSSNLNESELNESASQTGLPTLKRNQSTLNFKLINRDEPDDQKEDNRQLTRALSKESMKRFDSTTRIKPALDESQKRNQQRATVQSPEDYSYRKSQKRQQKTSPNHCQPPARTSNRDKSAYTFKYLNLKM